MTSYIYVIYLSSHTVCWIRLGIRLDGTGQDRLTFQGDHIWRSLRQRGNRDFVRFEGSGLHLVVIFLLDLDGVGSSSYLFLRFMFDRKEDGMVIRRKGRR